MVAAAAEGVASALSGLSSALLWLKPIHPVAFWAVTGGRRCFSLCVDSSAVGFCP